MALPYPEGEVYFKRQPLDLQEQPYNFSANTKDTNPFYKNILVEQVWNTWAVSSISPSPGPHPRSSIKQGWAYNYNSRFRVWDSTHVLFSDKLGGESIKRAVVLENNQNWNELRDRDAGGPLKTILRPVLMGSERYMYIDLTSPIRAIYFPIAHESGEGNRDLCTYLMVDFRLRQGSGDEWREVPFSNDRGLDYRTYETMCLDILGIYSYLVVPRQLRNPDMGLYKTAQLGDELITLWYCTTIGAPEVTLPRRHFTRKIDLAAVIRDNFGVNVVWSPYQHNDWVAGFVVHLTTMGIGMIPAVGPLLSVAFSIGMQAVLDPDSFKTDNILNLTADTVQGLLTAGKGLKKNFPKQWTNKKGRMFAK